MLQLTHPSLDAIRGISRSQHWQHASTRAPQRDAILLMFALGLRNAASIHASLTECDYIRCVLCTTTSTHASLRCDFFTLGDKDGIASIHTSLSGCDYHKACLSRDLLSSILAPLAGCGSDPWLPRCRLLPFNPRIPCGMR